MRGDVTTESGSSGTGKRNRAFQSCLRGAATPDDEDVSYQGMCFQKTWQLIHRMKN